MKLHIENFAKISVADIMFDGLTVIAGVNNTGKSTVGKVLYSFFRALSQMPKRVRRDRIDTIERAFFRITDFFPSSDQAQQLLDGNVSVDAVYEQLLQSEKDDFQPSLFPNQHRAKLSEFAKEDIHKTINDVRKTDDVAIARKLAYQVLDCVFHKQTIPLRDVDGEAILQLIVHGELNEMRFGKKGSHISHGTPLVKKVRYIANPDVLSLLNVRDISTNRAYTRAFEKYTLELAQELVEESGMSATEKEVVQTRLGKVFSLLDNEIKGNLTLDDEKNLALLEEGNDRPTKVENLSMGMKFFVLLKCMLLHGALQEKDVLILDEPENHLHPEWQVLYAEILVRLQKAFDLTLLVTSHSQFFVNALQRLAISEDIMDKTHFYFSKHDEKHPGFCTFEDVTDSTSTIFRSFNAAYGQLSRISKEFSGDDF